MRQPSIAPQQNQRRVVVSFDTLAHDQRSSTISFRFLDSHVERMSNRQCSWRQRRAFGHKDVKNGSLSPTQRGNTTHLGTWGASDLCGTFRRSLSYACTWIN